MKTLQVEIHFIRSQSVLPVQEKSSYNKSTYWAQWVFFLFIGYLFSIYDALYIHY